MRRSQYHCDDNELVELSLSIKTATSLCFCGNPNASCDSNSIQQGVLMGRRSEVEAEARESGNLVTSVSVGATAYIASGEIEIPPSALLS